MSYQYHFYFLEVHNVVTVIFESFIIAFLAYLFNLKLCFIFHQTIAFVVKV
jgi:hypothetical protein